MEPGREMDALVAEKVMGLTVRSWRDLNGFDQDDCDFYVNKPDATEPRWGHCRHLPWYSTDIAAAWEVVEKMHENCGPDEWCFKLEDVGQKTGASVTGAYWNAQFCVGQGGSAVELTTPHTICLAALKAMSPGG